MNTFDFSIDICLGYHCFGGGEYTTGEGKLQLDDASLEKLVALIRESGGKRDIEALSLSERLPEVYSVITEAAHEALQEACHRHWVLEGFRQGCYEESGDLMTTLEEKGLFHFEPDPNDIDEDTDEEDLEYLKEDAFSEWLDSYLDSLSEKDRVDFIETHYTTDEYEDVCDPYEYDILVPEGIMELARGR